MRAPAPIRRHVEGPGALLAVGITVAAAAISFFAVGPLALAAFLVFVLILVLLELWKDSARLEKEADQALTSARQHRSKADEAAILQQTIDELQVELARAERPVAGLTQLLLTLDQTVSVIDSVEKHRILRERGFADCPVVSVDDQPDGLVITAHSEKVADELVSEEFSLVSRQDGAVIATGVMSKADQHYLQARFETRDIQTDYLNEIADGHIRPEDLSLILAGLALDPYMSINTAELAQFRQEIRGAASGISRVLAGQPDNNGGSGSP